MILINIDRENVKKGLVWGSTGWSNSICVEEELFRDDWFVRGHVHCGFRITTKNTMWTLSKNHDFTYNSLFLECFLRKHCEQQFHDSHLPLYPPLYLETHLTLSSLQLSPQLSQWCSLNCQLVNILIKISFWLWRVSSRIPIINYAKTKSSS